jgi:large subunit ribosomal protein L13
MQSSPKQKTFYPDNQKADLKWHFLDAKDQVLGRLATQAAKLLLGKNKATYTPGADTGDKVVITNALRVRVTGKKMTDKIYYHHTGFPKGLRSENYQDLFARRPTEVIKRAISGMLPKNRLRAVRMNNLYIYTGEEHPHQGAK